MAKIFARIRRPSMRQGLIFGIILGVVEIIYGFIASFITQQDLQSLLSTIPLALFLLFAFFAGQRASQVTGKLGTGAMAGFWSGLVGAVIEGLVPLIGTFINLQTIVANDQKYIQANPKQFPGMKPTDYTSSDAITTALLALLFSIVFYVLISLIGGALGGMVGRRRALALQQSEAYQESMFESPAAGEGAESEEASDEEVEGEVSKDEAAK